MVLNIKELNLDKDKKYVVFSDGENNKMEAVRVMRGVENKFKEIGIDNNNIFYFPCPIIIWEK